jgi:hypothetical protein
MTKEKSKLIIIYLLNIFDLLCTQSLYNSFGASIESNLFGVFMLQNTPFLILYKALAVGIALYVLWWAREKILAIRLTNLLCVVYSILAVYHFFIICYLLYL